MGPLRDQEGVEDVASGEQGLGRAFSALLATMYVCFWDTKTANIELKYTLIKRRDLVQADLCSFPESH